MLNNEPINHSSVNHTGFLWELTQWVTATSFSDIFFTKYGFKSHLGIIYNFHTRGHYCSWNNQKYGNLLVTSNLHDVPDIQTTEYQTPLKNWWKYQNRRFEKQVINFQLELSAGSIQALEKEIQSMKQAFNSGGKICKKYNNKVYYLSVVLKEFTVWDLKNSGTDIRIVFESLDPFWVQEDLGAKFFENMSGNMNGSIVVYDSDIDTPYTAILQAINITGVWGIKFIIDEYAIEIPEAIHSWDLIVFDGKNMVVEKNGQEIFYLWEFVTLPILRPCSVELVSSSGTLQNYSLHILYDKIIL